MSSAVAPAPQATRMPAALVVPVALGTLLQALNSSMIAVALGQIRTEFHAGASASWLISGLYLATAVGAPTMGRLADLIGPRRVFLSGIALVGIAAVAAMFAPDIGWLIAMRVLLGIGTSAPYPAGLAMIRAEADRRGITDAAGGLGVLAIAAQVAVALGPPLGGVLVQFAGWRAIFAVNVPFVLIALVMAVRYLPADGERGATPRGGVLQRLDGTGLVLFTSAMGAVMMFLLSLSEQPLWPLVPVAIALVLLLVLRELRAAHPFLDVRLLVTNRPLTATYLRCGLTYVAFYAIFYGLPAWLEQARGLRAAEAGLVLLPIAGLGAITVVLATRLERRTGPRGLLLFGSGVLLLGGLALTCVGVSTPVVALVLLAAALGVPNGFNSLGNQTALYRAAPADQMGGASGLYRTSQYVGANLAAAVIELCFAGPVSDAGLHRMGLVVAAISAVLLVTALSSRHLRRR
jgi:MFS family permease